MADKILKQSKPKKSFKFTSDMVSWIVLTVNLIAVSASLFLGWQAMQPDAYKSAIILPKKPAASADPLLNINTVHQRQGSVVEVNPSTIGKDNPFK